MNWFLGLFLILSLYFPPVAASDLQSLSQDKDGGMGFYEKIIKIPGLVPSVFAFPGTACPVGSGLYKGVEAKIAAEQGVMYCVFNRQIIARSKSIDGGQCPPNTKPYTHPKYKPDDDTIWCTLPPNLLGKK